MIKAKNLIIGGGFSGLYLATLLEDSIIIESSNEVGGLLSGHKSRSGDFTFDVGGHVYTTKDQSLNEIMEATNARKFEERLAFFDFQKKVPYPLQYHADKLGIKVTSSPLSHYESFSSLLKHEFGEELYDKVLKPFNLRVWSMYPASLSADWIDGRVALMKDMSKKWGSNSSFYYSKGEDILRYLVQLLDKKNCKIMTNTTFDGADYANKTVHVSPSNSMAVYKGTIQYENVFDTTGIALFDHGNLLPYNHVTTIGIGLNRRLLRGNFHWWYNGTDNKSPIHRITLISRYHDNMAPDGCDSLLIEIPHTRAVKKGPFGVSHERDLVIHGILSMLREAKFDEEISSRDIEEVVTIHSKGYPIPITAHRQRVSIARREMMEHNCYLVGRWGAHGYYNLDHLIADAKSAVQVSLGHQNPNDYFWANYYYNEKRGE